MIKFGSETSPVTANFEMLTGWPVDIEVLNCIYLYLESPFMLQNGIKWLYIILSATSRNEHNICFLVLQLYKPNVQKRHTIQDGCFIRALVCLM